MPWVLPAPSLRPCPYPDLGNGAGSNGLPPLREEMPAATGIFLGMLLDAIRRMAFVPAHKLSYFLRQAEQLQQTPQVTARQLAEVAGLLVSFRPAVLMAPPYARGLFKAMKGSQGWDANMLLSELPWQDLRWWQQSLEMANGGRWDL